MNEASSSRSSSVRSLSRARPPRGRGSPPRPSCAASFRRDRPPWSAHRPDDRSPRDANRSSTRAGLFQLIEIQAEIVDRHLGGLIALPQPASRKCGRAASWSSAPAIRWSASRDVKFINSDSTVGSSRGGISRVGDSSAPRSGASSVKSRSAPACSRGDSPVAAVSSAVLGARVIELLRSPSGSPNKSMSTRFSPPSRFRSTSAPAPRPLPRAWMRTSARRGRSACP
jgi:hypothetical protein